MASLTRGSIVFVGLVAGLAALNPGRSPACSICRCGDPTFNALGRAGYTTPGFRIALDWERFDKDEGDPSVETETQIENRMTTFLSYGFNERFMVSVGIPYSSRELTASAPGEEPETIHTNGFSDPTIYGQALLWASRMSGLGRRTSVSITGGVKTPWGNNDVTTDGERVDEHGQPGTGSTDLLGTVTLLYLIDMKSSVFVSTGYRYAGENEYGYRYGNTFLANISYEHKVGHYVDSMLALNFRDAGMDKVDSEGTAGDDTGGALMYITPKVLFDLTKGTVLRIGAQIPVAGKLNGVQTERPVVNIGVTHFFAH